MDKLKKIICFSIYGDNPKYTVGALKNIPLANKYYPDWKLRFYVDNTVPKHIIDEIKTHNDCEIIDMTNSNIPGMYWRFLGMDDNNIDIFIVRDTDSRINERESQAVNDWLLRDDKLLHNIRDHPHHKFKIMGGLWGFKNYKCRTPIKFRIFNWLRKLKRDFARMDDMKFLDRYIYERFHDRMISHDDYFNFPDSVPFPIPRIPKHYYDFCGEIYDENDNKQNYERDFKILESI